MHRRISHAAVIITMAVFMITGCTSQASNIGMAKSKEKNAVDTGFTVSTVGSYDSADTAVVLTTDQQNQSVTFVNMDTGKQYTLYYDGTTYIKDKYGSSMSISQIKAGDVVDVNFLKGKRQIASMQLSPQAWVYENIDNYDLGGVNKTASIGSSTYSLPDDVVVLSEGQRTEVMDIVAQDTVSVRGIDHKIYSISVERGHGYLRLRNDQALIGGWIEVGNAVIKEITEDMLLVVPEGSYQVLLSNQGASCVKDVVVERDREIVLDVGDLEIPQDKTGKILLSVTPDNAEVKIDGKTVDISKAIELSYGIHQVHLEAKGYDSLTKYIQVGSEYAKISFTLEEQKEEDNTPSISQNDLDRPDPEPEVEEKPVKEIEEIEPSVSENTITPSKGNKVYIDAPKNVEAYLDGNYVGITPVSFKKVTGSHTVSLRKSGYKTKSYTIYLYDDGEDITYSFTDLEKEDNSVSGNDVDSTSKASTDSDNSSKASSQTPSGGSTQTPGGDKDNLGGNEGNQGNDQDNSGGNEGNEGNDQDNSGGNEGNEGNDQDNSDGNEGNEGNDQDNSDGNEGNEGNDQDNSGGNEGNEGNDQDNSGGNEGNEDNDQDNSGGNEGNEDNDQDNSDGNEGNSGGNTDVSNGNHEDVNIETIANSSRMFVDSINNTYNDVINNNNY